MLNETINLLQSLIVKCYSEGNKEFYEHIFIENGMIDWAIKGYTYLLDKQEDVYAFVDDYNKNDEKKYVMRFLPWERNAVRLYGLVVQ